MNDARTAAVPAPEPQDPRAWLAALLGSVDEALIGATPTGTITDWSRGAAHLFGWPAAAIVGQPLSRLAPPGRERELGSLFESLREGQPVPQVETLVRHADGREIDVLVSLAAIHDEHGSLHGVSVLARDTRALQRAVTAQQRAAEDVQAQQQVLQQIARGEDLGHTLEGLCREIELRFPDAMCSVLVVDPTERCLRHAAAPSLPAAVIDALEGLPVAVGMGACGTAAARGETVVISDTSTDPLAAPFRDLTRAHDLASVWSHPLVDRDGEVLGTFAIYRSTIHTPSALEQRTVTAAGRLAALAIERQRDQAALRAASLVDPLTGLPNRAQFLLLLERALDEQLPTPLAVLFLDLDRFKSVNDSMGHPAGDQLLVEAARRLASVLRSDDVLSRFGGDEFTILVRHAEMWGLAAVAERILDTFAEPFVVDGREFYMSVSIGVALSGPDSGPFDLIRDADVAMYEAKAQGAGRCVVFGEELRDRALHRVNLEMELRHALDDHELVLHYQPIFDLQRGTCTGVEALVRWAHPTRGLLLPDHFIPIAEEAGLIRRVGAFVLETALADVVAWHEAGVEIAAAINVSPLQLSDPALVHDILDALRRHRVESEHLRLEITESAVMEQLETARSSLVELAAAGVDVYIDDFGTGYSSISRLSELPVAGLKIDRRFTAALGEDPSMTKLTVAIIDLAAALDLHVVAEGIETEAALDALIALECPSGQGFHLATPVEAGAITALLRAARDTSGAGGPGDGSGGGGS